MRVARRLTGERRAHTAAGAFAVGVVAASGATLAAVGYAGSAFVSHRAGLPVACVCALAAVADLAGVRVRPQIPFQVPERWRRSLPLPAALWLWGLLVGTGFATAAPAYSSWALLLVVATLAHGASALVAGVALGIGRALPILVATDVGSHTFVRRAVRALAASTLLAATLVVPASAEAAFAPGASDPSAAGGDLAWEQVGVGGVLVRTDGTTQQLPGHYPAVGGGLIAWFDGTTVTVAERATLTPLFDEQIVGVRQLAVSDSWLVLRVVQPSGSARLIVQSLANTSQHRVVAEARPPKTLGRPALDGSTVVFARTSAARSSIVSVDAASGRAQILRASSRALLENPSLDGDRLLYVEVARCAQWALVGSASGSRDRIVGKLAPLAGQDNGHERGHTTQGSRTPCFGTPKTTTSLLWTTALDDRFAYLTILSEPRTSSVEARIERVSR